MVSPGDAQKMIEIRAATRIQARSRGRRARQQYFWSSAGLTNASARLHWCRHLVQTASATANELVMTYLQKCRLGAEDGEGRVWDLPLLRNSPNYPSTVVKTRIEDTLRLLPPQQAEQVAAELAASG